VLWFGVAILPVSNLIIPAGVILAERTLYLPSVALAIAVAGSTQYLLSDASPVRRHAVTGLGLVIGTLLLARTMDRNPTWFDSYTVMNTLAMEHPESHLAQRSRAQGLARVGEIDAARSVYATAIELAPMNYSLLIEAAQFYGTQADYARAEELLDRGMTVVPALPEAYLLRAEYHIRQGRGREGHRVALEGLARAGTDDRLFAAVSEAYVSKGDLEAAARARLAAAAASSSPGRHWGRLADIYDALDRPADAREARARSASDG
jgi:tetratricopeptide (TPR) repeat protein